MSRMHINLVLFEIIKEVKKCDFLSIVIIQLNIHLK